VCAGTHLHLELPSGTVWPDVKTALGAPLASQEELLGLYNLATALDPALVALTCACPFYEGRAEGAARTVHYRGILGSFHFFSVGLAVSAAYLVGTHAPDVGRGSVRGDGDVPDGSGIRERRCQTLVDQPLYRGDGIGHRSQLGERSPCSLLYRPACHGGVQARCQHQGWDGAAHSAVVDLSHELQPIAVGHLYVD
jgi:hypothetical protein